MTDVKQTGAERLAQVRDALWSAYPGQDIAAFLDGCVLLTAEEAEEVREIATRDIWINSRVHALLTPADNTPDKPRNFIGRLPSHTSDADDQEAGR